MAHCDWQERVGAYHDGELTEDQAQAVEAHIVHCPVCATELAQLRRMRRVLTQAELPALPAEALARIHQRLRRADPMVTVYRITRVLMAAAAVVLGACLVELWWSEQGESVTSLPAWELAAISPRADDTAGNETQVTGWIVADLARRNSSDE